VVMKDMFRFAD